MNDDRISVLSGRLQTLKQRRESAAARRKELAAQRANANKMAKALEEARERLAVEYQSIVEAEKEQDDVERILSQDAELIETAAADYAEELAATREQQDADLTALEKDLARYTGSKKK
jgi:uncharacterized protein (DUF2344 family)